MDAEIISLQKWKAEHPPLLKAWESASNAGIKCWMNWARLWFPWL